MGFADIFKGLLGGDPVKSISDLIGQFHMSPEDKAKVQQAAQELEAQREEIESARDLAVAQLTIQDRASARQMQVSVRSIMPPLLAGLVVAACIFAEWRVLTHGVPTQLDPVVTGRILGTLDAALMLVLSYYFGSSAGSDRKTELMAQNGNGNGAGK